MSCCICQKIIAPDDYEQLTAMQQSVSGSPFGTVSTGTKMADFVQRKVRMFFECFDTVYSLLLIWTLAIFSVLHVC